MRYFGKTRTKVLEGKREGVIKRKAKKERER